MANVGGAKSGPKRGTPGGAKAVRPLTKKSGGTTDVLSQVKGIKKGNFAKIPKKVNK